MLTLTMGMENTIFLVKSIQEYFGWLLLMFRVKSVMQGRAPAPTGQPPCLSHQLTEHWLEREFNHQFYKIRVIVYLNAPQSDDKVTHRTQLDVHFISWRENKLAKWTVIVTLTSLMLMQQSCQFQSICKFPKRNKCTSVHSGIPAVRLGRQFYLIS